MLDALCQPSFNIGGVFVFLNPDGLCFCSILRQGGDGSPIFVLDRNPEVTFGPSGNVARWRMEAEEETPTSFCEREGGLGTMV